MLKPKFIVVEGDILVMSIVEFHVDILQNTIIKTDRNKTPKCLGGGYFDIFEDEKKIYLAKSSVDYGWCTLEEVQRCIRKGKVFHNNKEITKDYLFHFRPQNENRNIPIYTFEWQQYTDYEKEEYDIELRDGRQVMNTYPNGGYFNTLNRRDGMIFESDVKRIRLSHISKYHINDEYLVEDDIYSTFTINNKTFERKRGTFFDLDLTNYNFLDRNNFLQHYTEVSNKSSKLSSKQRGIVVYLFNKHFQLVSN